MTILEKCGKSVSPTTKSAKSTTKPTTSSSSNFQNLKEKTIINLKMTSRFAGLTSSCGMSEIKITVSGEHNGNALERDVRIIFEQRVIICSVQLLTRECVISSLRRFVDDSEAQQQFAVFRDKLPQLLQLHESFPSKELFRNYSNCALENPSWTIAHIAVALSLLDILKNPGVIK